jgi:hypothetical protein
MEEGAHRTAGGTGASSGLFDSGGGNAALAAPANYHIPVPPPPPPPLVIKRGKIRKVKKRFKTHNKKEHKKDQQHSDIKETPPTDDEEKEKEKEDADGEKGKGVKLNASVEFSTPYAPRSLTVRILHIPPFFFFFVLLILLPEHSCSLQFSFFIFF